MAPSRRPTTGRRKRGGDGFLVKLLVPLALLVVLGATAYFVLRPTGSAPIAGPTAPACPAVPDVVVGELSVPAGPIGGYCQPELVNAASIIRAAQRWRTNTKAMDIGVMTAIGESGLRNLTYGDTAGPDSRGLFQQRSNYGPVSRRMNPYSAAYDFYQRMLGIAGWEKLTPTQVAHAVQVNANPDYYTPYYPRAVTIVDGLLAHHIVPALTNPVPGLPQPGS
jgi:hypothetical protein